MAHPQFGLEALRQEALRDVETSHVLNLCPVCGGPLSATCGDIPEGYQTCHNCSTVWKLEINLLPGEGKLVGRYGHYAVLRAFVAGFCREMVFGPHRVHVVPPGSAHDCPIVTR